MGMLPGDIPYEEIVSMEASMEASVEDDYWNGDLTGDGAILQKLLVQFDTLKSTGVFNAVKHNIIREGVQEIWTTNLLLDGADIHNRLNKLGYDLSQDEYTAISNAIHNSSGLRKLLRNINKSVLLTIDPNDSSQEAVESFLREVNSKYEVSAPQSPSAILHNNMFH
jgi:hypothetical protein